MAEMVLQGMLLLATLPSLCALTFEIFIKRYILNQVGLKGEALSLHSLSGSSSVEWIQGSYVTRKQPLTWFKVSRSNFN